MKKYDIKSVNLEFKNLLSGPAPIGRILNYIYLTGNTGLKHKNGYRYTNLKDNIGSAWCTEFMIGLGLVYIGSPVGTAYKLELTNNGLALFEFIKNKHVNFNEGIYNSDIADVCAQMNKCDKNLYDTFKNIFVNSYPFFHLKDYLEEVGYSFENSNEFCKDFFEVVAELYGDEAREAGFNRVPSLIQLCRLFGFIEEGRGVHFIKRKFEGSDPNMAVYKYTKPTLIKEAQKVEKLYKLGEDIAEKYGVDGNVISSGIVRNSDLQRKFKNNLAIEQKHKCIICGLNTEKMLIGSHIKPAATCNVYEKADTQNGLLLCANHDKLFDKYMISFNPENGKIAIDANSIKDELQFLNLDAEYVLPSSLLTEERKKYLKLHYEEFNKRILKNNSTVK